MHDEQRSDELTDAVLFASRALVAIAARSLSAAPSDVTLPQYRALVVLASRGPQRTADLAAELDVAPSSITRLCDRLERKRLVSRRSDRDDRRQVTIAITAAGRKLVDAVTKVRRRDIGRVVKHIPLKRRATLIAALNELGAAAGEVPEQAWSLGWGTDR
ncbi:MAG TPA: MarR family winged helix-turn-helix transcriptional regulator [Acidimicrobiales bacterium]